MEYNEKHPEPAYHCGALVAVFGEIQRLAMKDVNAVHNRPLLRLGYPDPAS